jgi:hypothetical protein
VRREHACFLEGDVTVLGNSNEQLAVVRRTEGDVGLVVFNCSAEAVQGLPAYVGLVAGVLKDGVQLQRVLCFSNGTHVRYNGNKIMMLRVHLVPRDVCVLRR